MRPDAGYQLTIMGENIMKVGPLAPLKLRSVWLHTPENCVSLLYKLINF